MFVGGQADLDDAGNVNHVNQIRAQADAAINHVERVLDTLGGRFEDLVKLNVFYLGGTLADEVELLRQIRRRVRGDLPPVISLVSLPRLPYPGMTVTIEAVAIDNSDGGAPRRAAMPYRHWEWPKDAEFSQGIRCGEMLFVSAQMARDTTGKIQHTDDIVSQARLTIDNIARVLAVMDADLDDVVKLNTWYRGHGTDADWRKAAQIRSDAFRFPGPGATGVPVPLTYPDGGLIRQECWAMRGTDGTRLPRSLSWPVGHWDWPMRVPFQQGVKVGKLIFLGGQLALDVAGKAQHPQDMRAQTRVTMDFINAILAGFGATMDDMVKVSCFYVGHGKPEALHENLAIRSSYFADPGPASTSVPLEKLGFEGIMLEVEGIAVLD
jgi:enamine deaminase RidA (YjgF/YER057c/UK114 family)